MTPTHNQENAFSQRHRCDTLIIGASLGGAAAALKLSAAGQRVLIVEPRTYPASELTATLRPWIEQRDTAPDLLRQLSESCGTSQKDGTIALNPDCLKIQLEDTLISAGIDLIYAALPIAIQTADNRYHVQFSGKAGSFSVACAAIIDTTHTQITGYLLNAPLEHAETDSHRTFTLEFDGVASSRLPDTLPLSPELRAAEITFSHLAGYRSAAHILIECRAPFPQAPPDAFGDTQQLIHKSELAMQIAAHLMTLPAFEKAYLAGISYELTGGADTAATQNPAPHIWQLPPHQGIAERVTAGEDVARDLLAAAQIPPDNLTSSALDVPPVREVDVLVIGGGTSGATAAHIAARHGANALLVEMNPGLGGTGTFGGVHSYWFGRRVGFAAALSARVNHTHTRIGHRHAEGVLPKWNIEARAYTLLHDVTAAGAEVLLNAYVIDVIKEENRICGVTVATRRGPVALRGKIIIDATGDADIATRAGADVVYGAERDHSTMWYALAQFARPGLTRNNFTSSVDVGSVSDYTRAILAGRRRKRNDNMHDHGIYIAPRESRHIRADVVLTLTDQLLRRCYDDVVNITFSNHDIKGHTTADWLRVGLIPPNLEIEVPYRALLPRNLENIIVVGKAISATHDALPAIRMQADLENLGGAAGLAAALSLQHGVSVRNVPIRELQAHLIEAGVLPPSVLHRQLTPRRLSADDIRALIQQVATDKPLHEYADMDINDIYTGSISLVELCCAGENAVPLIEAAMHDAPAESRLKLAVALALMRAESARPILLDELQKRLSGDTLPVLTAHIRHTQLPPDQGAMPDTCNLLYALGMVATDEAIPVWTQVIAHLIEADADDLRDGTRGIFYYVDALCYGIERSVSHEAAALLERLLQNPIFHNQHATSGFQADYFLERQAYLELIIARTLARCGHASGCRILIHYLQDSRSLLARHAHSELCAISGTDFDRDVAAWHNWLHTHENDLTPQPYNEPAEIQQYWNETVYISPSDAYVEIYN